MSSPAVEIPASAASVPPPAPSAERKPLTKKEIVADHPTWCPGCGDFSVLALYFKLIERRKMWQEKLTTISGIGCSSPWRNGEAKGGVSRSSRSVITVFDIDNPTWTIGSTSV